MSDNKLQHLEDLGLVQEVKHLGDDIYSIKLHPPADFTSYHQDETHWEENEDKYERLVQADQDLRDSLEAEDVLIPGVDYPYPS